MLKVMTLNLNYYVDKYGNWEVRRSLILDQIKESQPDLITLQAVKKEPNLYDGDDQATQLAILSGYHYSLFQPAVEHVDGSAEGSAILSHYPREEVDFLKLSMLTGIEDTNQRVLVNSLFHFPSRSIRIFNAHFSWIPEQATDNIREAMDYIQQFEEPYLLLGDLNTTPDSPLLNLFQQADMVDVWAELCPDESGFTFESDNPRLRIDYVWASKNLKNNLESIELVGNKMAPNGERPSDHLGLLVELKGLPGGKS